MRAFAESYKIKLLNSSPYYAQANGQAESSNKTLIKLVKKKIEENPRRWHEVLSEALWAHRISRHGATKVTPFELVYRNTRFITEHKPSNHIRARIKSHVYTTK